MKRLDMFFYCLLLLAFSLNAFCVAAEQAKEKTACTFECVDSHAEDEKGETLIATLKNMLKCLEEKDFDKFSESLENDSTMFDEKTKELIAGKDKIIERLKSRFVNKDGQSLSKFEIRDAYARVYKDTGTVTFRAFKQYDGAKPLKMSSHCSNIFALKNGQWKLIHFRTAWQTAAGSGK